MPVSHASPTRLDKIGACASAICAVHCVLTGAALGVLSVAGLSFLTEPLIEEIFLLSTALLGIWAMWHGWKRHGSWLPSLFFVVGLGLAVVKHFAIGHENAPGWAIWLSLAGAASLVTFFVLNSRLPHKDCGCFAHTECGHQETVEPLNREKTLTNL